MGAPVPRIAICVVTYCSASLIENLVASLPEGARDTEWTLVFADNSSSDDTTATIRRCAPSATLVETGANLGYAGGVNAAIRAAGPQDAYLILNADVRLHPGCAAALFAQLSPTVGVVVPQLRDARGELIWSMRRKPTVVRAWADALIGAERAGRHERLGEVVTDAELYSDGRVTDWAEGSTQLIGRRCAEQVGSWDESFFLYSEETEYHLRARAHGWSTWYEPTARATHLEGGSAASPRLWSLLVANRVLLFSRHHDRLRSALFWTATATREASRAVLGRRMNKAALRDLLNYRRMIAPRGPGWLARVPMSAP